MIVGEFAPLFFDFTFELFPVTFHLIPVHFVAPFQVYTHLTSKFGSYTFSRWEKAG
jgi:hypothetical protein